MVGYATTATFRSAAPPRAADAYASLEGQIKAFAEIAAPPVVVIQDLDDPPAAAVFGEILCSSYRGFGAAGLVTSGAGRDLEQVRALKFPVFTGGTLAAHGYCHFLDVNVPVRIGGVVIQPGDLLHGDANGVTTIPRSIASAVARACSEFIAAEQCVLDYVKKPGPTVEGLSAAKEQMLRAIGSLAARLRGSAGG